MEVRPIRTKREYRAALKEIEVLWDAKVGTPRADRLEVLTMLVTAYEEKHEPIEPPDPIAAIKFRMEQFKLERKDLERILGVSRGRMSELLNDKRRLTVEMIRKLNHALGIPVESLIQKSRQRLRQRASRN